MEYAEIISAVMNEAKIKDDDDDDENRKVFRAMIHRAENCMFLFVSLLHQPRIFLKEKLHDRDERKTCVKLNVLLENCFSLTEKFITLRLKMYFPKPLTTPLKKKPV